MDRWLFLFSAILVCCFFYPPFLGVWIGIAIFYGLALLTYVVLGGILLSFGAPKPSTHRRPKPATVWGVLDGRILLFEPVGKWGDQVVVV